MWQLGKTTSRHPLLSTTAALFCTYYFYQYLSNWFVGHPTVKRIGDYYKGWAFVTGSSSGLGRKIVYKLISEGMEGIVLHASPRSQAQLEALAKEVYEISNGQTITRIVMTDFSRPEQVATLLESIKDLNISLLVNNAGFGANGQFDLIDLSTQLNMITVNCASLLALTHCMTHRYRLAMQQYRMEVISRQQWQNQNLGSDSDQDQWLQPPQLAIINIGSLAAAPPGIPWQSTYAATKAFVSSFTHGISYSLREIGVRVILVEPGVIPDTNFQTNARQPKHPGPNTTDNVINQILTMLKTIDLSRYHLIPSITDQFIWWAMKLLPEWFTISKAAIRGKLYSPEELL